MVWSKGSFAPGVAKGSHSGYEAGGFGGGGPGVPMGEVWGMLRRQQAMREQQAEAQLDLMRQQATDMEYQRKLQRWEASKGTPEEQAYKTWRKKYAAEAGERQGASQAMAKALFAPTGGGAFQTPGGVAGMIAAIGPERAHEGMMQSGRILGSLSQRMAGPPTPEPTQMATGGGPPSPEQQQMEAGVEMGRGGAMPGGSLLSGVSPGGLGGMQPAQAPMAIPPNAPFTGSDLNYYSRFGPAPAGGLPPQQKGTVPGTVPETGPAVVHEGEAIVPEEQVDQPLLAYLRRDALKKGVPLGQGEPAGFKCGTLKRYQAGTAGEGPERYLELPPAGALETWARALGYGAEQARRGISGGLGGLIRGFAGVPEGALAEEEEVVEPVEGEGIAPEAVAPAEGGGTLEDVMARVRGGDFGTPEAPLELRGAGPPEGAMAAYGEGMEELRGMPENIRARHKAGMSQVEAERLLDHLQFHGHELDDNQKAMLLGLVKEKQQLAGLYGKDEKEREKFMTEQIKQAQAVEQALLRITQQEQATEKRQLNIEEKKAANRQQLAMMREGARSLRDMMKIAAEDKSPARRADAKAFMAMILSGALKQQGVDVDEAAALDKVEDLMGMPKEQQEMAITRMEQLLGGAR